MEKKINFAAKFQGYMTGFGIDNLDFSIYPNAEVRVEKAQYSVSHLEKLVNVRHEVILSPEFQRNNVWKPKQKCELVESILMGIPIPMMYLFENKFGQKQVVDGKQRITALLEFLNNELVLKGLQILGYLNGKRFKDLDQKLQGVFEDYQLFFYIIQPPTSERVKYDIFDRVNRGGTKLNNQEMRNALYFGKATEMLKRLSTSIEFLNATDNGIASKRMRDQYVILRTLAFYLLFEGRFKYLEDPIFYRSDIDDFLAKVMTFINTEMSDEEIADLESNFKKAMSTIFDVLGKDAFRFNAVKDKNNRRPINMLFFEALSFVFMDTQSDYIPPIELLEKFKEQCDEAECFKNNTDSLTAVKERHIMVEDFINHY